MINWNYPWDKKCEEALSKAEAELQSQDISLNKKLKNWNDQYITAFSEEFALKEKRLEVEELKSLGWGVWTLEWNAERRMSMCKEFEISPPVRRKKGSP